MKALALVLMMSAIGLLESSRIAPSTLSAIAAVPVSTTTAPWSNGITVMLLPAPVSM